MNFSERPLQPMACLGGLLNFTIGIRKVRSFQFSNWFGPTKQDCSRGMVASTNALAALLE
jgi:hypothetical protein